MLLPWLQEPRKVRSETITDILQVASRFFLARGDQQMDVCCSPTLSSSSTCHVGPGPAGGTAEAKKHGDGAHARGKRHTPGSQKTIRQLYSLWSVHTQCVYKTPLPPLSVVVKGLNERITLR